MPPPVGMHWSRFEQIGYPFAAHPDLSNMFEHSRGGWGDVESYKAERNIHQQWGLMSGRTSSHMHLPQSGNHQSYPKRQLRPESCKASKPASPGQRSQKPTQEQPQAPLGRGAREEGPWQQRSLTCSGLATGMQRACMKLHENAIFLICVRGSPNLSLCRWGPYHPSVSVGTISNLLVSVEATSPFASREPFPPFVLVGAISPLCVGGKS